MADTHARRLFFAITCTAMIGLSGCSVQAGSGPNAPAAPQSPAVATGVPLPTRNVASRNTVAADGVVQTTNASVALGASIDAKVATVNVEPGQHVKRGDTLATFDSTSLRDALEDAQLQLKLVQAQIAQGRTPNRPEDLDSAKAALVSAQLQYDVQRRGPTASEIEQAHMSWQVAWNGYLAAQVNRDVTCGTPGLEDSSACHQQDATFGNAYERERTALAQYQALLQPVTKEKLQQAYASVVQAQARVKSLESGVAPESENVFAAQLAQAESAVKRAQTNLQNTIVLSPCDCVVQEVNLSVGTVPKGVAATLINLDGLQFKTTNLTERELTNLKVGQRAEVRLRANDVSVSGKVAAIVPQSSGAQGGAALFTVLVDLDASSLKTTVLPGMTGRVEVATATK